MCVCVKFELDDLQGNGMLETRVQLGFFAVTSRGTCFHVSQFKTIAVESQVEGRTSRSYMTARVKWVGGPDVRPVRPNRPR